MRRQFAAIGRLRLAISAAAGMAALGCLVVLYDDASSAEPRRTAALPVAAPAAPLGADVRVEAIGTQRSGITGRPAIAVTRTLALGDLATWLLHADRKGEGNLCAAGFVTASDPAVPAVRWEIQVRVVGVADDRTTLEVRWTRNQGYTLMAGTVKDDVRTMTLGPSDVHVLDFVENANASSPCASLFVRISAQPAGPGSTRPVSAHIWTVDEGGPGSSRSVYQRVEGTTGQQMRFEFQPLDFAVPGLARAQPLKMTVGGTLVATIGDGGFVDVTLNAVRRTSWGGSQVRGEGRVQFRSAIGETAAVVLPQPAGRLTFDPSSPPGTGTIDLARVLNGRRVSLYVKIDTR